VASYKVVVDFVSFVMQHGSPKYKVYNLCYRQDTKSCQIWVFHMGRWIQVNLSTRIRLIQILGSA
jgi:hypothetical protein